LSGENLTLRQRFISKYNIRRINFFEEQIFDNVRVTLCSFDFYLQNKQQSTISIFVFPCNKQFFIDISNGSLINLLNQFSTCNSIKIENSLSKRAKVLHATLLSLQIFDSSPKKEIGLLLSDDKARTSNSIRISTNILLSYEKQRVIANEFNSTIKSLRQKYSSLIFPYFLSCQYKGFKRKRIPVKIAFSIINYIIKKLKY